MKKLFFLAGFLIMLTVFTGSSGGGNNEHSAGTVIQDMYTEQPKSIQLQVDSIVHNDRKINATVDVINDLANKP